MKGGRAVGMTFLLTHGDRVVVHGRCGGVGSVGDAGSYAHVQRLGGVGGREAHALADRLTRPEAGARAIVLAVTE